MQLEQLLQNLGIAEHMKVLSDWRDDMLREKAAELQSVRAEMTADKEAALSVLSAIHKTEVEAIETAHALEIKTLTEQLQGLP